MTENKIFGVKGDLIEGVIIKKLNKIPDERGTIFHMLRNDDPIFKQFGEIYFSKAYPGIIKGWHLHREMTLNYAVIYGSIKLVLYDARENSKTKGNLMEIFIGDENYLLVQIPPHIWNGYKVIGTNFAIVANCATMPFTNGEMERIDPFSKDILYNWEVKYE